jgi:hypothetical protein
MIQRAGNATLPLHCGHVPAWLSTPMAALGRVVAEAIVHHYGRRELLRRLANPFWFQSFGAVMGMDWHSSGITTSVIGALKRGLAPLQRELGVFVCAGLELVRGGPDPMIRALRDVAGHRPRNLELFSEPRTSQDRAACRIGEENSRQLSEMPALRLPAHHDVRGSDVNLKRLHATLAAAAESGPKDFGDLLLTPGLGARTVASLAFIAEVIHGGRPIVSPTPRALRWLTAGRMVIPFPCR